MKKLLTLMLAAAIAVSMVACGAKKEEPAKTEPVEVVEEAVVEETPAVDPAATETEAAEEAGASTAAAGELPEIDGFTKVDMGGAVTYASADGMSAIAVVKLSEQPGMDVAAITEALKAKDKDAIEKAYGAMNAVTEGAEVKGDFASVSGKDVYKMEVKIPANPELGITADAETFVYMFLVGEEPYSVSAVDMTGKGAPATQAETVIAAL